MYGSGLSYASGFGSGYGIGGYHPDLVPKDLYSTSVSVGAHSKGGRVTEEQLSKMTKGRDNITQMQIYDRLRDMRPLSPAPKTKMSNNINKLLSMRQKSRITGRQEQQKQEPATEDQSGNMVNILMKYKQMSRVLGRSPLGGK